MDIAYENGMESTLSSLKSPNSYFGHNVSLEGIYYLTDMFIFSYKGPSESDSRLFLLYGLIKIFWVITKNYIA